MIARIVRLFKRKNQIDHDLELTAENLLRYPPVTYGLPSIAPETLIRYYDTQIKGLIPSARIKLKGKEGEACFEALYLETINNLARYAHLLPASEYHHHHDVGGLFYHSLETGLGCLEYARAREGGIPKNRYELNVDITEDRKPRWVYGAWVLGVLHDIGKVIVDINVSSKTGHCDRWNPVQESLTDWAISNNVKRYSPTWISDRKHQAHQSMAGLLYQKIVSPVGQKYIADGGGELQSQIVNYLNGRIDRSSFLHKIVMEVDSLVTKKDMSIRWDQHFGDVKVGIEKAFIATLRTLIKKMSVNKSNGEVFIVGNNVFLRTDILNKVIQAAQEEGYEKIPRQQIVLVETLIERSIIERPTQDSWYGTLQTEAHENGKMTPVIKLSSPVLVYQGDTIPQSISAIYQVPDSKFKVEISRDGLITNLHKEDKVKKNESKVIPPKVAEKAPEKVKSKGASASEKRADQVAKLTEGKIKTNLTLNEGPPTSTIDNGNNKSTKEAEDTNSLIENSKTESTVEANDTTSIKETNKTQAVEKGVNTNSTNEKNASTSPTKAKNCKQIDKAKTPSSKKSQKASKKEEIVKITGEVKKACLRYTTKLSPDIHALVKKCEVITKDNLLYLSQSTIDSMGTRSMIDETAAIKSLNLLDKERGFRKININGHENSYIVLNNVTSEFFMAELGISASIIEELQTIDNKIKENSVKSDLPAKVEMSNVDNVYEDTLVALSENLKYMFKNDEGVWLRQGFTPKLKTKLPEELQEKMDVHIATSLKIMEEEGIKYINILMFTPHG